MTTEQAIEILKNTPFLFFKNRNINEKDVNLALDIAIQALEQEPCEDAINRQALLDAFGFSEKTRKWGGDHSGYNTMMLYEIQDMIESAPSVKPQHTNDEIQKMQDLEQAEIQKTYELGKPKTGHWKVTAGKHICSNCGTGYGMAQLPYSFKWCPNCGARMGVE